jgi:hypothetical protein
LIAAIIEVSLGQCVIPRYFEPASEISWILLMQHESVASWIRQRREKYSVHGCQQEEFLEKPPTDCRAQENPRNIVGKRENSRYQFPRRCFNQSLKCAKAQRIKAESKGQTDPLISATKEIDVKDRNAHR